MLLWSCFALELWESLTGPSMWSLSNLTSGMDFSWTVHLPTNVNTFPTFRKLTMVVALWDWAHHNVYIHWWVGEPFRRNPFQKWGCLDHVLGPGGLFHSSNAKQDHISCQLVTRLTSFHEYGLITDRAPGCDLIGCTMHMQLFLEWCDWNLYSVIAFSKLHRCNLVQRKRWCYQKEIGATKLKMKS